MQNLKYNNSDKPGICTKLLDAVRASPEAHEFFLANLDNSALLKDLFEILRDDSPDMARLQACYYISQFPVQLLRAYEEELLPLQIDQWENIADFAIMTLARINSRRGLAYLIDHRIAPEMSWEAKALRYHLQEQLPDADPDPDPDQ